MKKKLLFLFSFFIIATLLRAQVVSTVTGVTVCAGTATVDLDVKVSSFIAVGSISLKFTYVNSEINSPSVVYKDAGLETWGTFTVNTSTPGVILISAYDPDVVPPVTGLTLSSNTTLFTLRFNIGTIVAPAVLSFSENAQGTSCEYGGVGPDYTPFTDTPTGTYYINGSVTVVADPVAPGLTKNPAVASVCAGQTLTVSTSPGSGGTGTIADEYSYSTNNGSSWSAWSASVPSFAAVTGTNLIRSRRTATGTNCDESTYNSVSWTVAADPTAPAITKSPSDASVCAGQVLTVTTSAGSGGTGTIADEYSYSTNNGSSWSGWSASVPSFAAVTGTNLIRSRRTATGTGCDESSYNSVSWTVVATPAAPGLTKNPATASVCAGETLTVSTTPGSGGTGTIADEYRYSTNNGSSWSAWSTSVPSFAGIAGTNRIQSRRTATGTGCTESSYNEVSWVVNAKQKISGTFNYYRSSGNVLLTGADITVNLYKSIDEEHNTLIATDVTDANGYYEFPNICPDCDYDIVATSTHPTDGAINTTDAAQANYWNPNAYPIEKVRFHAGDVSGPDLFVGGIDAGRIQQHFVNGTALDGPPWTFWTTNSLILHNPLLNEPEYTEYYPKVNLSVGSDLTANMYGLVSGDFNRSFNPNVTKSSSTTVELVHTGNITASAAETVMLPLRIVEGAEIGALSLILHYPVEYAEITAVEMNETEGTLEWSALNGELRISWLSSVPAIFKSGEAFLFIRLETTPAFTGSREIGISLAADPLNELADGAYQVIGNAVISTDLVMAGTMQTGEGKDFAGFKIECRPNPFKESSTLSCNLPFSGIMTLEVHNLMGVCVLTLENGFRHAGPCSFSIGNGNLPDGIYLVKLRLQSEDQDLIRTLKLINN